MTPNGIAQLKLAAALMITIGASAGGWWYSGHKPAPPAQKRIALPIPDTTRTIANPSPTPAPVPPPAPTADTTAAERPSDGRPVDAHADLPQPASVPLEDLVERAMPGVVRIETDKDRGSGFFVRPTLIVTNAHVTGGAPTVTVTSQSGERMPGRVLEASDTYDIAVIQIGREHPAAVLPLGDSSSLRLGQGIVALGWAEGTAQSTVARGVITGLREMGSRQMVQTDAVPHPGDSGGPVVDRAGAVVGITTFRFDNGSGGLAVPIDDAKAFVQTAGSMVAGPASPDATSPLVSKPSPSADRGALSPPASDADARRQRGAQQYERDLAAVAQRAARLDDEWTRHKDRCRITTVPAGQTREWFNLYDPRSPLHRTAEYRAAALNDLQRQADSIGTLMRAAEELARRADVYPGTRRDLRARQRLDYAGWDP